jgi:hypothetical protein
VKIDGGCHCGHIRYEAEIDPATVAICHCTDCQTLSGSAFRTVVPAKKENFKLLAGTPKRYVKTAESGNRRVQAFCPECGTPIYASAVDDAPMFSIRLGTVRQRDALAPQVQTWSRSAQPWVAGVGSVKRFEKQAG